MLLVLAVLVVVVLAVVQTQHLDRNILVHLVNQE
jgi:hypothetical protein